jgi:hypothetical protein
LKLILEKGLTAMDFDDIKYFEAKDFWKGVFAQFKPRDDSAEETDAFYNALEDFSGE